MDISKIKMINAGAGSGKTYRITELLFNAVDKDGLKPSQIFATTFTNKAAQELVLRVRTKFLEKAGQSTTAKDNALFINEARIGTLHSLCGNYLKRFAFELGLSPDLEVLEENSAKELFRHAIDEESADILKELGRLGRKLSITDDGFSGVAPIDYVKKIAAEATANGINESELIKMGERSWLSYNDLLDEAFGPVNRDLTAESLIEESRRALSDLLQNLDVNTQQWYKFVKGLAQDPANQKWANWDKKDPKFPKKALPFVEKLESLRSKLGKCVDFRADIKSFTELAYAIAKNSMMRYRELKQDKGVLDFADLEKEFLTLLDKPQVQGILKDELELLIVDEFQDTNPMQLAIYLKLSKLVAKTIFVGDLKQSIYGFRGSDPKLMQALQTTLENNGNKPEKLQVSRRSTQKIVEHCNQIFRPFFGEDACLEVWDKLKWQPPCKSAELFSVNPEGKNKGEKFQDFTEQLKLLVSSGPKVLDKATDLEREMHWDDIGILTNSNNDAKELTKALLDGGVPAQFGQDGLLEEPEIVLARALLSLAYGMDNKVAYAEIRSILHNHAVADWLSELLDDDKSPNLLLEKGLGEKVECLRASKMHVSPREMLTTVIYTFSLPDVIRRWDDDAFTTQQRLANLDALSNLIEDYENQATSNDLPVSLAGLNKFLTVQAKDKNDIKGMSTGRAVSVMTIHKAKGLEWPCVILSFMQKEVDDRFFGVSAQSQTEQFNIDQPLDKRWVRFLAPFSAGNAKGLVKMALKATTAGKEGETATIEEARRLLYVAYTRSRNYLAVINMGKSKDNSFQSLLEETDCEFPDVRDTWPKTPSLKNSAQMPFIKPSLYQLKPRYIQPSAATMSNNFDVAQVAQYGDTMAFSGQLNTAKLGDVLHQLISILIINLDADLKSTATELLKPFTDDDQKIEQFIAQAKGFVKEIKERFKPIKCWVEMPVTARNEDNQTIKGSIDLLLETDNGLVVIDHKLKGAKTLEQQQEIANTYAGQLSTYQYALEKNGYLVNALILNLFSSGTLLSMGSCSTS